MNIEGSIALVTGANRGLGAAFRRELLDQGAAKVYAGAGRRQELTSRDVHVLVLHVGLMDTDMTAGLEVPKSSPDDVARQTLTALQAGDFEALADEASRRVHNALSGDLTSLYPSIA